MLGKNLSKTLLTQLLLWGSIVFAHVETFGEAAEEFISVEKGHVLHKFMRGNSWVDDFTENRFEFWEDDTFSVVEVTKDKDGVAIDLGAWIGTTSIWLAKNFFHVIVVEPDKESLIYLEKNLQASACENVTVCSKAISGTGEQVLFGPRVDMDNALNVSTSRIKRESDSQYDCSMPSLTFEQIIHDYWRANEKINKHKVTFIKCDIEGTEEAILEDVLRFSLENKCRIWMSFHLDWWSSKKITDFEDLLNQMM